MTPRTSGLVLLLISAVLLYSSDWPQFRGPNASGISPAKGLPVEFGPTTGVVWKTSIPQGNSSPVIAGDKIFLTAVEGEKLFTLALSRETGRILWRREAPRPRKQVIERPANGPASASPVSDGRNVYAFFADFGLLAYGPDGNELWRIAMGPFNNPFGHGSSPILSGDTLLMNIDQDTGSYLLAVDRKTGRTLWKTERPHAQRGYATPVLNPTPSGLQVLIAGSYRLSAYDIRTGKESWFIRRLPWQIKPTPVLGDDRVYFITFSGESEPGEQENVQPFGEALATLDTNKDGKLSKDEIVDRRARDRFEEYLDLDDSGFLEKHDWEQLRERRLGENGLRAYRLGGKGDITESHFVWKNSKSLPNVPSPLFHDGILYTLKEGGIFTSFDAGSGQVLKQARITGALGAYYASPVVADGKIYVVTEDGKAAVLSAGAQWEVLRVNNLGDGCKATPAFSGSRLYIRTYGTLYCFAR